MSLIISEKINRTLLLRFNRQEKKNALSQALFAELNSALDEAATDDGISVVVIAGSEQFFCAGVDIKEIAELPNFATDYMEDFIGRTWQRLIEYKKPLIAAVSGLALGGGCELAMSCDIIYAADNAEFGQPEVLIGAMPGAGGTQRLTRVVGKSLAMEMCLTGRRINAEEALAAGLVSAISTPEKVVADALACAEKMEKLSLPILCMIKEAINGAQAGLAEGLRLERRLFQAGLALHDRKEGMEAFMNKRPAQFQHK